MRTRDAIRLVAKSHEEAMLGQRNNTRFYNVVNPLRGGEARVDVYAARFDGRTRKPVVKCVQRHYSNRRVCDHRDVYRGYMGGFFVDFSDVTDNCRHYAREIFTDDALRRFPVGGWDSIEYTGWRTAFLVSGTYLNDFAGTKYAKSGAEKSGLHPMRFFELYGISPSIEHLVKAGLQRLLSPGFVKRLNGDRELFAFFRSHLREIQEGHYGASDIFYAKCHKVPLERARVTIEAKKAFGYSRYDNCIIPDEIDRYELAMWCERNQITATEYRRYASYVNEVGKDITAFGVTYPRNFRRTLERIEGEAYHQRIREAEAKEKANVLKNGEIEDAIKEMAKRLAALNGIKGNGYCVVVPSSRKDLISEGKVMHNCIGAMGYDRKIANGDSLIFFLRGLDGKKNVDVEVKVIRNGRQIKLVLAQCYQSCNAVAPKDAHAFVGTIIRKATALLKQAA